MIVHEQGVWFKSFSVNQRQPGCLLRMAGRVDAIDPGLSRERVVSRGASGTANCANRAAVEGESLSALIAVIKFENLPDPPPTRILLRISNRSWAYSQYCHAPKRIISRHFEELRRRAIVFFEKRHHTFRSPRAQLVFLDLAKSRLFTSTAFTRFNRTK